MPTEIENQIPPSYVKPDDGATNEGQTWCVEFNKMRALMLIEKHLAELASRKDISQPDYNHVTGRREPK